MLSRLEEWIDQHWLGRAPVPLAFCGADEAPNLAALAETAARGWIHPILIGNQRRIQREMAEGGITMGTCTVIHRPDTSGCVHAALELVARGEARLLMRGRILMHDFIKCILNDPLRADFLPRGALLSHVGIFENPHLSRLMFVSDGGIVLKPDLNQKVKIIQNSVLAAQAFGIAQPRVGLLAAVETVDSGMPTSLEDAILAKMADRGQIKNALIDGPLSIDVALVPEVAESKGVHGPVAGRADVLIVDKIEVGNAIYKAMIVFGQSLAAGVLMGASRPIIITSRSDTPRNKILSICAALLIQETKT
jgi:phosphate butyryltransferase